MVNIGEKTEIINASELTLQVGDDTYIMLTNLQMHVGRPEDRTPTTDAGALYTYGKGDNWFTATLVLTQPEAGSLNTLTQIDGDGDMTSRDWKIVGTALDSTTVTYAATGVLRDYDIRKTPEGTVEIDIFVRITTDTVVHS